METSELESFLILSEELHFGRTADRLYLSQSRVSQLLRSLENRVGGRLLERTSRRVRLTPLGERFLANLRPAYAALHDAVDQARADARGITGVLRVGFAGTLNERLMHLVAEFQDDHPEVEFEIVELPLSDPFGSVQRAEIDAAIVLTPVHEPALTTGPVFSREPQTLVVSTRHPFAGRASLSAEDLAAGPLIGIAEPAPRYWREVQAPSTTPAGLAIPRGPKIATLQEGLTLAAVNRGVLLLCAVTARYHQRQDLVAIPVTGLPDSTLTVVWQPDHRTSRLDAFVRALARYAAA